MGIRIITIIENTRIIENIKIMHTNHTLQGSLMNRACRAHWLSLILEEATFISFQQKKKIENRTKIDQVRGT